MKTLIVYYSFSGNNALLAAELKDRLNADVLRISEMKKRTAMVIFLDLLFRRHPKIQKTAILPEKYDLVLLLAPVWNAHLATPMKTYLALEKDHIREYAFISVCGGREGQEQKLRQELVTLIGKAPVAIAQLGLGTLLPPARKNDFANTASIKVDQSDIGYFESELKQFFSQLLESYPAMTVPSLTSRAEILSYN